MSSSKVNGLAPSRRFSSFWNNSRLCVLRCDIADGAISVSMRSTVDFIDGILENILTRSRNRLFCEDSRVLNFR